MLGVQQPSAYPPNVVNRMRRTKPKDYESPLLRFLCLFVWGDDIPLVYINERNGSVNYRQLARYIHCSLSLRSAAFWITFGLIFTVHTLVFFLEPTDTRWPPLITGSVMLFYGWLAWFYTVYRTVYYHLFRPAPTPLYILVDLLILYFSSLFQNLCFFSAVAEFDSTAFVGMNSDTQSDIRIYWLAFNLSAETLAGLGTGSIYANPESTTLLSFLPIWLNSVQGILYNGLIVGSFVALIALAIKRQIKHLVVLESKLDHYLSPREIETLMRIRSTDSDGYVSLPDKSQRQQYIRLRNRQGGRTLYRRGRRHTKDYPPHGQY